MNGFATWFLGQQYVILLSGVVDAMEANPNGVRSYIGPELGMCCGTIMHWLAS